MENNAKTALFAGVFALLAIGAGTAYLLSRNDEPATDTNTTQSQQSETEATEAAPTQNIVEIAAAGEDFTTLVTAVQAAELAGTLGDESQQFTVFAPTNAAFDKLPAGTVTTLVQPENKATLTGILTYHVVSGAVLSSQLSDGQTITTVQGGTLTVDIMDGMVYLVDAKGGRAQVTTADIKANNGIIHVIDSVLMPN